MMRTLLQRLTTFGSGLALTLTLFLLTSGAAWAHGSMAGPIRIDHPWARATAPSAPAGAAFMVLTNTGATADRLLSASSPVAGQVELHTHLMQDGVMKMRRIDAIDLAPGAAVALAPGGLHVMLIGLTQPLVKGKAFALTLTFEKAGTTTVEVEVQGPGETAPAHSGH